MGGGQQAIGEGQSRALDARLLGPGHRLLVALGHEMREADAGIAVEVEGIERAEAGGALEMRQRGLGLAAVGMQIAAADPAPGRVGIERQGLGDVRGGRLEVAGQQHLGGPDHGEDAGIVAVQAQRRARQAQAVGAQRLRRRRPAVDDLPGVAPASQRVGARIGGIEADGLQGQAQRLDTGLRRQRQHVRQRPHHVVVGFQALRALATGALDLGRADGGLEGPDDALGDPVFEIEDVLAPALVAIGPDADGGRRLDQLGGDADAVAGDAQAALQQIAHAELASDLRRLDRAPAIAQSRAAGDDEEGARPRQRGGDLLGDAVGEIVLIGIAAEIVERQHRDRRPLSGPVRLRILRDLGIQARHQGLIGWKIVQRVERAVLLHPLDVGAVAEGRIGIDPLQPLHRRTELADERIGAGQVVARDRIERIEGRRLRSPGFGARRLAQLPQHAGAERQRAGIVGMQGDLGLDPFQAAARGGLPALAVAEGAIGIHHQAEGAEVLGLQLGRALEERDRLAVAALGPEVAGGEEVGLEQIGS
jgi:hypothetical protein